LEGLSIGRLAAETGMSKSGLFAHFGSKEELQLATIELAEEIFREEVMTPALAVEGVARVRALSEGFIAHIDRQVFPGGCFFASAAAEMDTRPGRVRDRVLATLGLWSGLFLEGLEVARARGEIAESSDPAQLTFEINAMLAQANGLFLLHDDTRYFDMARRAIADRLERAAV
ncbi:MAG: TetR family transcriptional regulator, partial [Thermoleophilia bacterium]|nr:TetR family transcriptional regulator [Thermoleophilia bacterium]